MKKIERNSWFIEGFSILAKEGFSRITIENLCTRLKVTKGSFYHHFKNMDGYTAALMEYWLETNTYLFIRKTEELKNVKEKYILLSKLAADAKQRVEVEIRAWGYFNPIVSDCVKKVDGIRLEYVEQLGIETGLDKKDARHYAMLEYATLVGIQHLFPELGQDEVNDLLKMHMNI